MPDDFLPFKRIGLCFSGGGYRATFFSLGTAAYLEHVNYEGEPLLKNVTALSTVSGGTLFGVAFTKAVTTSGFQFKDFYAEMYSTFNPANDTLLNDAVAKISNKDVWETSSHKRQSLINAFALKYAEMPLFSGKFGDFNLVKKSLYTSLNDKEKPYNLAHVCFNATDFSFGLPFRFQNSGIFGNKALKGTYVNALKNETVLGDIVASSSCFPLGFEPLVYPDDFYGNQISEEYIALKNQEKFKKGVGIMDGGITDNQGLDSMLNINSRKSSKLDLIIVNDVSSFQMKPWKPSTFEIENETSINDIATKLFKWLDFKWLYPIILLVGVGFLVFGYYENAAASTIIWPFVIGAFISGIGALLTTAGLLAHSFKKRLVSWFNTTFNKAVPEALLEEVSSFKHLGIDVVKRLLTDRASSAATMVQSVFLNQIRRLNYGDFYKNPNLENKRITSRVDELDGKNTIYKKFVISPEVKTPLSKSLKNVAKIAAETPTTLWWDETDVKLKRMDSLIACGQFTTCYNLLTYIIDLKKVGITSPAIEALEKQLRSDWKTFTENPYWLV